MVDDLPNIEDKEEVVTISKSLLDRINRLFEVVHIPEIKKEEDDWKIEDEDKPQSSSNTPYGGEVDTTSIRRAKPPKKNNDEDLTITY